MDAAGLQFTLIDEAAFANVRYQVACLIAAKFNVKNMIQEDEAQSR